MCYGPVNNLVRLRQWVLTVMSILDQVLWPCHVDAGKASTSHQRSSRLPLISLVRRPMILVTPRLCDTYGCQPARYILVATYGIAASRSGYRRTPTVNLVAT